MAYVAHATTTGGRNGHVETSDGLVKLDLSVPKDLGGPGKPNTANPEMFFAAGYSACFGSAIEYVASLEKLKHGPITVTADVTIDMTPEKGFFLAVVLKPHVEGVDHETAQRLAAKAHADVCPYSKATHGNIDVKVEVV